MQDKPWKDSMTVQFAVGATLILIFAWWMFTGDIPFLSKLAFSESPQDSDGNVQAVEWLPVIWGMLFQACVIVGASAIGLFSGIWTAIVRGMQSRPVESIPSPQSVEADAPVLTADELIRSLAQAVAVNDVASKLKYEALIRRPYAVSEMVTALDQGDFKRSDELAQELKQLAGGSANKPPRGNTP